MSRAAINKLYLSYKNAHDAQVYRARLRTSLVEIGEKKREDEFEACRTRWRQLLNKMTVTICKYWMSGGTLLKMILQNDRDDVADVEDNNVKKTARITRVCRLKNNSPTSSIKLVRLRDKIESCIRSFNVASLIPFFRSSTSDVGTFLLVI